MEKLETGVKKPRRKRVYTSMFDEFRPFIEECCDKGMTIKQAWQLLPQGYTYAGLYHYITANKVRAGSWKREVEARNNCNKCEYCKHFKNTMGTYDKTRRICTLYWQLIGGGVKHCPTWCEYKNGNNEERDHRTENN